MNAPQREFMTDAGRMSADDEHGRRIASALKKYESARDDKIARYADWEQARAAAARIKHHAVNHLADYLEQFTHNVESRGGRVFFAADASRARDYILHVLSRHSARSVIKSKTMTTEEIHLNEAMEHAGLNVTESDLGEYIVQLRGETPYHFVFPAMHLSRREISDLFEAKLGAAPTDDAQELTMIARRVMRKLYCTADVGVSGANFLVAETGMISITENEGNARLTTSLPRVHIAVAGIEKIVPTMKDLALLLPMLATAGAGQALTCYNTLIGGPRAAGEPDGPDEFHVVLLDNGRTKLLADVEQRDALHCIRCGACLNVCPIFRTVGGHTYHTTYQGPIGSVITPHLRGVAEFKHLSHASSLCGACTSVCPVRIDLHHHLLHNRRNAAETSAGWIERGIMRAFALAMTHPRVYRAIAAVAAALQPLHKWVDGSPLDPMRPWTATRSLPPVAKQSFHQWWKKQSDSEQQ